MEREKRETWVREDDGRRIDHSIRLEARLFFQLSNCGIFGGLVGLDKA
jgi:hypothetical protein